MNNKEYRKKRTSIMIKYKQQVKDMLETHKDLFTQFREIHDSYAQNPKKWQKEFNEKGDEILPIIRRYENSLCGKSEGGKYGKFSENLADKFWGEIRILFPKIDYIGMS